MSNYDKVKELIAQWLSMRFVYGRDKEFNPLNWFGLSDNEKKDVMKDVNEILSIPNLLIKADNQELPESPYTLDMNIEIYKEGQQDMIADGWVKTEKR